jgi:N-acetylglucosamine-6-sulfatase
MPMIRVAVALAIATVAAALAAGCGGNDGAEIEPDPHYGVQPNFVFILTDDQNLAQFDRRTMPNTVRLLADHGTSLTRFYTPTPLCCPSRAALLTGQYGHNNGVLSNVPGYPLLGEPENLLPDWLQRVGYQTALVGKWLNGYQHTVDKNQEEPPGWDKYHGLIGAHGYYDFKASNNGHKDIYERTEYLGRWIERTSIDMVRKLAEDEDPFFLQVNPLTPHVENFIAESGGRCGGEAVPARRDLRRFAGSGLPNSPSINEPSISDKPTFLSEKPPLTQEQLQELALRYECRAEALRSLDRSIGRIVRALAVTGELKNTVVIFMSDNGTFHGEHRLPGGKGLAYDEAAHMPAVLRVPEAFRGGAPIVRHVDEPTMNIDVVPTIVDLAGTRPCVEGDDGEECRVMDGRSLVPLLEGDERAWPRDRPILHELDLNVEGVDVGRGTSCRFVGVRQGRWLYVRHTEVPDPVTGACVEREVTEIFDVERDPYQLRNLSLSPVTAGRRADAVERRLDELTTELQDCAGIEGRDAEPASGHYCQ